MKQNLWILSSEKQPYTNGDWLGAHGELKIDDTPTEMLGSPLRVLRVEAIRDGKRVEVFVHEKQAEQLANQLLDAFYGAEEVDGDDDDRIEELERENEQLRMTLGSYGIGFTQKRIEKLEAENANLRKALVMWAQNPPTQIHDSITLETPSEEIAKTVADAIQNDWRAQGMQVHRAREKWLTAK